MKQKNNVTNNDVNCLLVKPFLCYTNDKLDRKATAKQFASLVEKYCELVAAEHVAFETTLDGLFDQHLEGTLTKDQLTGAICFAPGGPGIAAMPKVKANLTEFLSTTERFRTRVGVGGGVYRVSKKEEVASPASDQAAE